MPSTVYKGDLTEVSFGHETAMKLIHAGFGTSFQWAHTATDAAAGTSTIQFSGGATDMPCEAGVLAYPIGMLVGCQLTFKGGTNYGADDNQSTGKTFTIVAHTIESGPLTQIIVTPALATAISTPGISAANDVMILHGYKLPTMDVDCDLAINADASIEKILTDQFLGLAATVTLPETKVDLKRYHVVGLGRDVAVQVPGRFTNEGGSFEVNLHNPRWLYYALGMESVSVGTQFDSLMTADRTLSGAHEVGASYVVLSGTISTFTSVANSGLGTSTLAIGDYIIIKDTTLADVITYADNSAFSLAAGAAFGATGVGGEDFFNQTQTQEIRRIVAIDGTKLWLDDALCYPHANGVAVRFARFNALGGGATKTGSPHRESTGALTGGVTRLLYSRSTLPSFALEVSIRRHDTDGIGTQDAGIGLSTDPKQLTRVFRGCKIKDWSITADTDAALRMTVNYDAALCYTDTGQLETTAYTGNRFDTHRMFEDTANSVVKRKDSGIEIGTQKPYMFYNGQITIAGTNVGQVVSFTLTGNNGTVQHYTINGSPVNDSATDQVPYGGTRNAAIAVEGKTEYSMDMEIIVDDPVFYHKMRRAVDHTASAANQIRLQFTKAGTAGSRENINFLIDDFVITEAPLPIPEDKGVIKAPLKIMPKAVRIVATDTLLHC